MNFSPKLKRVMTEIKAILEKEDIAAVVVLHTEQHGEYHSEFLLKLDPSNSLVRVENGQMTVKAKKEDKSRIIYSANMLSMLAEVTGETSINLFEMSEKLDEASGASHSDKTFRPDNYSDN